MDIPDYVKIKIKAKVIEVKGLRGKLVRDFKHLNIDFEFIKDVEIDGKKLKVNAWFGSRKTTAAIRTALSHVDNLITGVTKGVQVRKVDMIDGVTIVRSEKGKDEIVLDGNDIGTLSQGHVPINAM
ncbi:hypothetical protein QQ045_019247 [Rhodiola kirilowii]